MKRIHFADIPIFILIGLMPVLCLSQNDKELGSLQNLLKSNLNDRFIIDLQNQLSFNLLYFRQQTLQKSAAEGTYLFEERDAIKIGGKGMLSTYFLNNFVPPQGAFT